MSSDGETPLKRRWMCGECGWVYKEEVEETPWEALSEGWKCPHCQALKQDFYEL